ncbi:flagellar hook-associated protein FlgL [Comamonas composti]|uniref:flagellar hook-associated protein FlgL n=1 Tax=Comamonas composti TaxID=408558 RepID=UPI00041BCA00|nr:flagellar hook-associated protein FlgL [Comamonas composti]
MSIARVSTANMYDNTINNLGARQSNLVDLMEKTSSGKRVVRPSDDPVAAAQAERARTRMERSENDQRVLGAQRDLMARGESVLGTAQEALTSFRDLILKAGNGSYDQKARDALVQEMSSLRDQILSLANSRDLNGLPIFRGLGSQETPFLSGNAGAGSQLQSGQPAGNDSGLPIALDGYATWLNVPTGNGVFMVTRLGSGSSTAAAGLGAVIDPGQITGDSYQILFSKDPVTQAASYSIQSNGSTVVPSTPFTPGQSISVGGMAVQFSGEPANGDSFELAPSTRTDLFSVLDKVISAVRNGAQAPGELRQALDHGLNELDAGSNRVAAMRSFAGDQLNRADRLDSELKSQALLQEESRSRSEDLDMIKALSEVDMQKVGMQAALQSYAQIQKLSLFNFIG